VPTIAIVPVLKGQKLLVRKAGKVNEVRVETGLRKEGRIQILDGLNEGDTVLISGILSLKPGMPVEVKLTNF
jgi:membrane fusion protein (multidrug efflux system)